jgi:putative transposase
VELISNFKTRGEGRKMKQSKFTESQIVAAIRRQEAGTSVKEISRELGISEATFYNWKAQYGGMEVSELKRVKELKAELARFEQMYAEVSYDLKAAKDLIAKKW